MKTSDTPRPALLGCLALIITLLLTSACVPQNMVVSPLGTVVVGPGEDIQIRSLEVLTGSIAELGIPRQRVVAMALADYGPIKGHKVTMGAGLDSLCTAAGGKAAAETAVGDRRVVGVIGTSCSLAAAAASPVLSEAGPGHDLLFEYSALPYVGPARQGRGQLPSRLLPRIEQRPLPGTGGRGIRA